MTMKKLALFLTLFFFLRNTHAQVEVSHLSTKGYSAFGFGGFLNFGIPINDGDDVTIEAGVGLFGKNDQHIAEVPFLLGYRHTFNGNGDGFYAEPLLGYTIGGTDIQKTDSTGYPIYDANGHQIDQKVNGLTAGLAGGYIFPGRFAFNIALRYEHIFVPTDPHVNIISLRLSHTLSFGRRREE